MPARTFKGKRIEGLLMNVRVVQGIFDDLNAETAPRWVYPDTKRWDADRNTTRVHRGDGRMEAPRRARVHHQPSGRQPRVSRVDEDAAPVRPAAGAAAPEADGQGPAGATPPPGGRGAGNPPQAGEARGGGRGPAGPQPENSAIDPDGNLRPAYMARLQRILDKADELGMVAIVGYFYFGQDQRVKDEAAVQRAVLNATNWILDHGYRNVLVEVNNECNISYDHEILKPPRVTELIALVQKQTRDGRRLLVSTSFGGTTSGGQRDHPDTPITSAVVKQSDFVLIHGNGPNDPALIQRCIAATRGLPGIARCRSS